jgi:2'-5' RNA ligase
MKVDRASSFGSRVWWVGPSEVPAPLSRLALRLREGLRRHAVPHERGEKFTPHVTILRDADRGLPGLPGDLDPGRLRPGREQLARVRRVPGPGALADPAAGTGPSRLVRSRVVSPLPLQM